MRAALHIVGALCLWVGHASAERWALEEEKAGVRVYTRDQAGSDVDAIRATIVLPYSTDAVAGIMTDLSRHPRFMPALKRLDVVRRASVNGRRVQVIYQINHVPALDDRDVVLYTETWSEKSPAGVVWRSAFRAVTNEGPPPTDDRVRITQLNGTWRIEPIPRGGSVFTYVAHTEIGGNIPDFLAESGQIEAILEMLVNFGTLCRTSLK